MKKLDTPEIGDPSVSGSGGVSADGAGALCLLGAAVVEEPPFASVCSFVALAPFDFDFDFAGAEPPVVLPCACWARTCGVSASPDAPDGDAGAGAGTVSAVDVAGVVAGVVAGASGAGVFVVVALGGDVSGAVVVPVEDVCSLAPSAAGASMSANTASATSSIPITGRRRRAAIGSPWRAARRPAIS
jgi:hypothetical protein